MRFAPCLSSSPGSCTAPGAGARRPAGPARRPAAPASEQESSSAAHALDVFCSLDARDPHDSGARRRDTPGMRAVLALPFTRA